MYDIFIKNLTYQNNKFEEITKNMIRNISNWINAHDTHHSEKFELVANSLGAHIETRES